MTNTGFKEVDMIKDELKISVVKSANTSQLVELYKDAGWWEEENDNQDPEFLNKIIKGSFCFVIVKYKTRIIGMGRAISDGVSDAYIQDVAVHSDFRSQGIGIKIMDTIIEYLKTNKISWIGLISEPKAVNFYKRYGFSTMVDYVPFLLKESKL